MQELNEVYLTLDGLEALRLADYEGLNHQTAAERMGISRQTFGRIVSEARRQVAKALVLGHALRIHGGNHRIAKAAPTHDTDGKMCSRQGGGEADNSIVYRKKENHMKKIAITSEGPGLDDRLDPRFGRAAGFVIVDPETLQSEYIDNGASQAMGQGAGIQAAEIVARAGVAEVLTGSVGPKAFQALQAAGIRVGQNLENLTVRQALEAYKNGRIEWASQPNRGQGRNY